MDDKSREPEEELELGMPEIEPPLLSEIPDRSMLVALEMAATDWRAHARDLERAATHLVAGTENRSLAEELRAFAWRIMESLPRSADPLDE